MKKPGPNRQMNQGQIFIDRFKSFSNLIFKLKNNILSVLLRGLTLGSKFVLILFIARFLPNEELGIFGIMTSSIAISIQVLGMDFYVFNTREILAHSDIERPRLIRDQLIFHVLTYAAVLPFLMLIFLGGFLPWKYLPWFYLIVILEHVSQEIYRLLITLSKPVVANIVFFFRSGIWAYGVIILYLLEPSVRNTSFVWIGWLLGLILSILAGLYSLRGIYWRKALKANISWKWMKKGLTTCLPFLGATIALKTIEYADRFFIQHYYGEGNVGIYTFYANIANVIQVFIFTGITMVLYPKLVEAYQKGEVTIYKALIKKMTIGTIIASIVLLALAVLLIKPVLLLTGKSEYFRNLSVYWILLSSAVITALGQIPHYGLYVRKQDKQIIFSTFISLVIAILLNRLLVPTIGLIGAAMSSLLATTILGLVKVTFLLRFKRRNERAQSGS